jgi:uncharacterized FAD-dependent dehydrogenase
VALGLSNGETAADRVVLAIGHSARDTFETLLEAGVYVEPKPFSIGFRIEHPQSIIDNARFGQCVGHPILGAADYKLAYHASNGRSVYSFCMCPGGTVVAATSEPGRLVTNGRASIRGKSATPIRHRRQRVAGAAGRGDEPLAGIAFSAIGKGAPSLPADRTGQRPPACRRPGASEHQLKSVSRRQTRRHADRLSLCLPDYAVAAMREAYFSRQIRHAMDDAVMTGSKPHSPVRMTRGPDFQSLSVKGLYPAGEGAGYAGGILSASVDGIKVAEALALSLTNRIAA